MKTISYSALDTFSKCKKMFEFGYTRGLRTKSLNEALSFGSAGHACLEAYYLEQDWNAALDAWRDKAINLTITNPVLPIEDESDEEYLVFTQIDLSEITERVREVFTRYMFKWKDVDRTWTVLEVEKRFEIPVPNTDYVLVGVWDLIVKDSLGRLWLVDHKFPGKTFRDYEGLELDAQIGIYQWAAREYGYDTLGFIYNQILAKLPAIPSMNKTKNRVGGYVSVAECFTEWETYRMQVIAAGEEHLLKAYEEEMYPKLSQKAFFDRKEVYRSEKEIDNFYIDLQNRLESMEKIADLSYREPDKFKCAYCSFKEVCVGELRGEDMSEYIELNFERREK
jgi:hypothetical protein